MKTRTKEGTNSNATNFLELRVYGLMRSGNHAIIDWIRHQYSGCVTCFLNNVKHGDYDPYANHAQLILAGVHEAMDLETLRKLKKHLLIYSYEDSKHLQTSNVDFLSSVFQQDFERNREHYLGISNYKFDILIIRDPFNCLASRIKLINERKPVWVINDINVVVKNWKRLAKEAISIQKYPRPGKIVVNYNKWVSDRGYREELSGTLMGSFNDSSINRISSFGGGSSFSGLTRLTMGDVLKKWHNVFDVRRYARIQGYVKQISAPRYSANDFIERWRKFSGDENYRRLFDREIVDLSEELFGEIRGTRDFLNSLGSFHA